MFLQVSVSRDVVAVRDEALKMIHSAFDLLHQEFQKLDGYILEFVREGSYSTSKRFFLFFSLFPARRPSWLKLLLLYKEKEKLMKFTDNNRDRFYRIKQHFKDHTFKELRVMFIYVDIDVQMLRRKATKKHEYMNEPTLATVQTSIQACEAFYICLSGAAGNDRKTSL